MNVEEVREFALSFAHVEESMPFGGIDNVVYKIAGKMFMMILLDKPETFLYLKCEQEHSAHLKEHYRAVVDIPHFGGHWIGLYTERDMDSEETKGLITNSHNLVFHKLPKKTQAELRAREP